MEDNQPEPPGFMIAIYDKAKAFAQQLCLDHPELSNVGVVLDWKYDLNKVLAAGVWSDRSGMHTPDTATTQAISAITQTLALAELQQTLLLKAIAHHQRALQRLSGQLTEERNRATQNETE